MYLECPERALYTWSYFHEKSSNFIGQSTESVDCPSKGLKIIFFWTFIYSIIVMTVVIIYIYSYQHMYVYDHFQTISKCYFHIV